MEDIKIQYLTNKQWQNRIKTIETKTLKQLHHCSSMISEKMKQCIIEYKDSNIVIIDKLLYKKLRGLCMSEDFNNTPEKYFNDREFIKVKE